MKNIKKIIRLIIEIFFVILILISLFMIIRWFIGTRKNKEIIKDINKNINIEEIRDGKREVDFDYLKNLNSDTVAYLSVDGVDIAYPVVKTNNNDFYLNHSFDKSKNVAGWIFMDYRNNDLNTDKNTIIYGHNMKDGSMFGKLKVLKNNTSREITLINSNGTYHYKMFSIYEVEEEDYYINTAFSSDDDYYVFLKTIADRSLYDYNYEPSISDHILTLSTCSSNNKRLVVHAYRIN